MTFTDFVIETTQFFGGHRREMRFGQAVFNILNKHRPDISSQLMDSPLDPFYKDSVSDEVWQFIKERW
jgi:hypothetical protein